MAQRGAKNEVTPEMTQLTKKFSLILESSSTGFPYGLDTYWM